MVLDQRHTSAWTGHRPSDLALVNKFWAQEIQPLYYDHVYLDAGKSLERSKEEKYCVSFFNAVLHPAVNGISSPAIHIRTMIIKDDKFTAAWWPLFVEAIPLMNRLQRLALVYDFRETFFSRVSELAHLFPPTLSTLALTMQEYHYVSLVLVQFYQ